MREILGEAPGKPYSRGTRKGNMVFVSGQLGWDANDDPDTGWRRDRRPDRHWSTSRRSSLWPARRSTT